MRGLLENYSRGLGETRDLQSLLIPDWPSCHACPLIPLFKISSTLPAVELSSVTPHVLSQILKIGSLFCSCRMSGFSFLRFLLGFGSNEGIVGRLVKEARSVCQSSHSGANPAYCRLPFVTGCLHFGIVLYQRPKQKEI